MPSFLNDEHMKEKKTLLPEDTRRTGHYAAQLLHFPSNLHREPTTTKVYQILVTKLEGAAQCFTFSTKPWIAFLEHI